MNIKIDFKMVLVFASIIIINTFIAETPLGLVVLILQYAFVVYLIGKKKMEEAIFWHFIFMITSYARLNFITAEVGNIYNYFTFKLVGPVTFSYLFSFFLLMASPRSKQTILGKNSSLFLRTRKYFYVLFATGFVLGLIGLLLFNYFLQEFIGYSLYLIILLIHIELLVRNNTGVLLNRCFDACIPLLIASFISGLANMVLGFTTDYGEADVIINNSIAPFILMVLLAVPNVKQKGFLVGFFFLNLITTLYLGASGKTYINLLIVLTFFAIRTLSNNVSKKTPLITAIVAVIVFGVWNLLPNLEGKSSSKFHQFQSLTYFFKGDISSVDDSPYIRLAAMKDIYEENLKNPIYFLVGRGYGGYFEDHTGLLRMARLDENAFKDEYIAKNKFPTAHSTYAIVPLLNGFGGLFLLFFLMFMYAKRSIKGNYLSCAAFIWILSSFYYDILTGLIGLFFIFASEYNLDYGISTKQNKFIRIKEHQ